MEQYLKIGIITSTHGLKGEVKVFPVTDDAKRFSLLKEVLVSRNGSMQPLPLGGVRFFKDRVILKFRDLDSIEAVEGLVKSELFVERKDALPLGEDEYYIADLIGMEVLTKEGEALGSIRDVLQTGANDVYCVDSEKYGEILIPAIKQCIMDVDLPGNKMTVDLLPGLLPDK